MSSEKVVSLSLQETIKKVEATLLPALESHVENKEFSTKDGLDFLDVKNGIMLSYLIDIVTYIRDKSQGKDVSRSLDRLNEMKVVLDKMRGLDKKLRYQIDKLLAANTSAAEYAIGGDNTQEDPLQFRPNPKALADKDDSDDDNDSDSQDESAGSRGDDTNEDAGSDEEEEDVDDDLAAARATTSIAKGNKKNRSSEDDGKDDGVYRAPRTTAVPYAFDQEQKAREKDIRVRRKMRATELAQTLRAQYGDAPEQEDLHGGSDYGKQRAAARRLAEREAERTKFEEDMMIRLQTSRKDKKEKKRLLREEGSNLNAIANLGNLVRETKALGRYGDRNDDDGMSVPANDDGPNRYGNGKRRREQINVDGQQSTGRRGKTGKSRNSLQAAFYNSEGKSKKKKSRR